MSLLLSPLNLGPLVVRNRAWVAPMCQYSCFALDGRPTDWHLMHLGSLATGGFGLLLTEATAVVPQGRISPQDTGLWDAGQVRSWQRVTDFVHQQGVPIGVQLAHAGRKAGTYAPWSGHSGSVPSHGGGWLTVGPSAGAFTGLADCRELTRDEVRRLPEDFAAAASRAVEAGFDAVEVHAAHGYLLHQFLSPLVNRRTDEYGGDLAGRTRLLREVVAAVRAALPTSVPTLVRVSATDWADSGWDLSQTIVLARGLAEDGVALVDVSSGGAVAHQQIEAGPRYQVPMARAIREQAGVATAAVGLITDPHDAEAIIAEGAADVVLLGRAAIREPRWGLRAASELGVDADETGYVGQLRRATWRGRSANRGDA